MHFSSIRLTVRARVRVRAPHRGVDEGHCTVGVVTIRDLAGMEGG